jgi:hypothetical protein
MVQWMKMMMKVVHRVCNVQVSRGFCCIGYIYSCMETVEFVVMLYNLAERLLVFRVRTRG